jgi:tyrosine-protein kinase
VKTTPTLTPPSTTGPTTGQTLKDYLRILWSRKWLVLLITVIVVGGVEYLTFRQTPVYAAETRVVAPPPPPVVNSIGQVLPQVPGADFLTTEAELIRSPLIAERVVEDLGLDVDPVALSHRIEARPVPETNILRIAFRSNVPAQAAEVANSVAEQYIEYRREVDVKSLLRKRTNYRAQIRANNKELETIPADSTDPGDTTRRSFLLGENNTLETRIADIDQVVEEINTSGQVLEKARTPNKPVSPDKVRNGIIGVMLGLVLGMAAAFVLEYMRDNLSSSEEVEQVIGAPVLALVPLIRGKRHGLLLSGEDASGPLTESFRTLRTNLQFAAKRDGVKSVVVTSPSLGDGKTMTAANVAVALAQVGSRVILIDGDLRRPRLHKTFDVPNRDGLSSVLDGDETVETVVTRPESLENLRLITSGPVPDQPTELLGGPRMEQVVESCQDASDFVIIDSPPTIGLADPSVLASYADGVLLVINQEAGRRILSQARDQLEKVGAQVLGVVVNKVQANRRGYYYYDYYTPYYKYTYEDNGEVDGRRERRRRSGKTPTPA